MSNDILFEKVLIANRGEIAIRIAKTLKKMGIKSVAVYSEADTNSLHVQMADEAYYIGPSPATESYLSIPNILEAIRKSGANAVHPGYGFLSENADFAKALRKESVVLIGPSAKVIKQMGDKIEAKKIAQDSGVNTIPGYMGTLENEKHALTIAEQIGYPVMIKAAAGGGGRGMRVVKNAQEMASAYDSAQREAENSFSDSRVFIEKFIQNPRHIEIQVIADQFGHVVCLGERDCSIQRHHQKVIEEAPSIFIGDEIRQKMYDQVKALVSSVKYHSAGTVEFIVDQNKNFYFLEMNTRLQVEHCVTEMITGLDIVELMLKIAAKQKLPFSQDDIKLNGFSVETRIYSEDPSRGFLPSSGRITEYKEPNKSSSVRVDSAVKEGYEVSMFYDAMIAKLITHAPTREEAIKLMRESLAHYLIKGISHNISFLEAIMNHENFMSGDISTNFIETHYAEGFSGADITSEITETFLNVGIFIFLSELKRNSIISDQLSSVSRAPGTRWVVNIDDKIYPVFTKSIDQGYAIRFERKKFNIISNWTIGSKLFKGVLNDRIVTVKVEKIDSGYLMTDSGVSSTVKVRSPKVAELEKFMLPSSGKSDIIFELNSPLAGRIADIKVTKGDQVKIGQELLIIEAMKMENILSSEINGIIKEVAVTKGESVSTGQLLIEFE